MRLLMSWRMRRGVYAAAVGAALIGTFAALLAAPVQQIPNLSCAIAPDPSIRIQAPPGAAVHCGIDLGSRSVKLSVVSIAARGSSTVRDERVCRRTLGMGAIVFDSRTGTARALPDDAIARLTETIQTFQAICRTDGGTMAGVEATQWARDATNITAVRARVRAETGLGIDVLTPAQEAEYGYVAASLNAPGRVVLDPGSNSFQLSWRETSASRIESVLVEYGYVRGSTNDFEPASSYAAGRAAYQVKVRGLVEKELSARASTRSLTELRGHVRDRRLGRDLIVLGQDGAVDLAIRDRLRDPAGAWIVEPSVFDAVRARQPVIVDPAFGVMTAPPVQAAEISAYLDRLGPADFRTLSTDPVRAAYGQKTMVVPALVDLLLRELDLRQLIMVPQEMTTGYILAKVR